MAHVAHLPGASVLSAVELIVDNDTASAAGTDGHVHHIGKASSLAAAMLRQSSQIAVIVNPSRLSIIL